MRTNRYLQSHLLVAVPPVVGLAGVLLWVMSRRAVNPPLSPWVGGVVLGVAGLWLVATMTYCVRRATWSRRVLAAALKAIERGDYSERIPQAEAGDLVEVVAAYHDARTELARGIADLLENRDRMATVLSGMVEGVLAVDSQYRVLLANDACRSLLGIATRDVLGRPLLEVVRNLDVQQTVAAAIRGQESPAREIPVASDSRRMLRVLATRLPGAPCPGVVVVLQDVSELRRLENLRRDFVANVSHELKTPLSSIKAYAETLRMGAINDPENNLMFVERIEEQATRLNQLIMDLLHLARVETGKEAFEFTSVSLPETSRSCVEHHAERAAAAGVELRIAGVDEEIRVWADAEGLRVILDNLVSNAIKFTPRDGTVWVRYARDAGYGTLEVEDTGIGIEPQHQQRIFERFYRVDRARSRDLGGTGLGLAIVKHLCQAFSGEVRLTSSPGRGSLFRVRLPLAT